MMLITSRDLLVFKMLDKFRILNIDLIKYYCGFSSYRTSAGRLKILYDNGYVDRYRKDINSEYVYYLKRKGLLEIKSPIIGKNNKKVFPKVANFTIHSITHELEIAKIVMLILERNKDLNIDDIKLDREMVGERFHKKIKSHVSDIKIEKYKILIELELSKKNKEYIIKNVGDNQFYYQLWIIPKSKKIIKKIIEHEKKLQTNTYIEVVDLESIDKYEFNLSNCKQKLESKLDIDFYSLFNY